MAALVGLEPDFGLADVGLLLGFSLAEGGLSPVADGGLSPVTDKGLSVIGGLSLALEPLPLAGLEPGLAEVGLDPAFDPIITYFVCSSSFKYVKIKLYLCAFDNKLCLISCFY